MRRFTWSLNLANYHRALELLNSFEHLEQFSDDWYATIDEVRSLPNFPREWNPATDLIELEKTSASRS